MHISWQQAMPEAKTILEEIETKVLPIKGVIAPEVHQIMRAFELPLDEVKVLIVGQDPYPTPGHAIGYSFAVDKEVQPLPRSLKNILIELKSDLGSQTEATGDLSRWSRQGVMLLNRHLTTNLNEIGAHYDIGWSAFTDLAIKVLNRKRGKNLVAILWGNQAQQLVPVLCDCAVLTSAHPSPLSARRGFFGSKPFSRANVALIASGQSQIDWSC